MIQLLHLPPPSDIALSYLPPTIAAWFRARFSTPTAVQRLAWSALLSGTHLLISAPTGTGKTLAAFLPSLSRLLDEDYVGLRVLYLAPLRALVNDIARNLESYLDDLFGFLPSELTGIRRPRIACRTSDSSALERRRLMETPPDILLTTPESLALLLSHCSAANLFAVLNTLIVDEVHALVGNKRGADLSVSLERLSSIQSLQGYRTTPGNEVQRIGLSATATPLTEAAQYLMGDRPGAIACPMVQPALELTVEPLSADEGFLRSLTERLARELPRWPATLVFTNTRNLSERLGWVLRQRLPDWDDLIAVHHSALSASRRREVEEDFKAGELRCVITSTSLELGIDIGPIDQVVLVHPPGDVIRLLQRVGRSGHGPTGRVRRGLVLTAHPAELLQATVTVASGLAAQCEPLQMSDRPLDVLCQQLLGMVASGGAWTSDDLFALVRRAKPFRLLSRKDFDDCLTYLCGLDHHGTSWLPARLTQDGDCWVLQGKDTARLIRRNLGTILEEPGIEVRSEAPTSYPFPDDHEIASASLDTLYGQVAEAFADRLEPGDRFLLDGRCLEVRRREGNTLRVEEVLGRPQTPVWGGEGWPLSSVLSQRLYILREQAAEALRESRSALLSLLSQDFGLSSEAALALADYFEAQERRSEIPDSASLLIEVIEVDRATEYYLHTPLNRLGNDALARVVVLRLARDLGRSAQSVVADLGFSLRVPGRPLEGLPGLQEQGAKSDVLPTLFRHLLRVTGFDEDLNEALVESESLRQRFTQVAQIGLMVLRNPLGRERRRGRGRRRKVGGLSWGGRELFEQIRTRNPDFVLLRQALSEVRTHLCDAQTGRIYLERLAEQAVRCRWLVRPSPFAEAWTQADAGPFEFTETPEEALRRLHRQLTTQSNEGET